MNIQCLGSPSKESFGVGDPDEAPFNMSVAVDLY